MPPTTWSTRARRSQSSQGVATLHCSSSIEASCSVRNSVTVDSAAMAGSAVTAMTLAVEERDRHAGVRKCSAGAVYRSCRMALLPNANQVVGEPDNTSARSRPLAQGDHPVSDQLSRHIIVVTGPALRGTQRSVEGTASTDRQSCGRTAAYDASKRLRPMLQVSDVVVASRWHQDVLGLTSGHGVEEFEIGAGWGSTIRECSTNYGSIQRDSCSASPGNAASQARADMPADASLT